MRKLIRKEGIRKIKKHPVKIIIFIGIAMILILLTVMGSSIIEKLEEPFSVPIYAIAYYLVVLIINIIILDLIIYFMTVNKKHWKIRDKLKEIDLINTKNEAPILITLQRQNNGLIYNFITDIPLDKFNSKKSLIESKLNLKIFKIENFEDMQHIKMFTSNHVTLEEMVRIDEREFSRKDFEIKLGISQFEEITADFSFTPHWLIGGGTGSGKSNLMKQIIFQSMNRDADVVIVDFKGGLDFQLFSDKGCQVITDIQEFEIFLLEVETEMENRTSLLIQSRATKIEEYNNGDRQERMRRKLIFIDEIAEVLNKKGIEKAEKDMVLRIEKLISKIARLGRASGIHLIISTQRPDADILDGQIKSNLGLRICGRADSILSRIILDNSQASEEISQSAQGLFIDNSSNVFKAYFFDEAAIKERKHE